MQDSEINQVVYTLRTSDFAACVTLANTVQNAQGRLRSGAPLTREHIMELRQDFIAVVPHLASLREHEQIRQIYEALIQLGLYRSELTALLKSNGYALRDENGLTAEEDMIWKAYKPDHNGKGEGKHPELTKIGVTQISHHKLGQAAQR